MHHLAIFLALVTISTCTPVKRHSCKQVCVNYNHFRVKGVFKHLDECALGASSLDFNGELESLSSPEETTLHTLLKHVLVMKTHLSCHSSSGDNMRCHTSICGYLADMRENMCAHLVCRGEQADVCLAKAEPAALDIDSQSYSQLGKGIMHREVLEKMRVLAKHYDQLKNACPL